MVISAFLTSWLAAEKLPRDVIASPAKQSDDFRIPLLLSDCFVAGLLAMTPFRFFQQPSRPCRFGKMADNGVMSISSLADGSAGACLVE
jgi:hypothetical protein